LNGSLTCLEGRRREVLIEWASGYGGCGSELQSILNSFRLAFTKFGVMFMEERTDGRILPFVGPLLSSTISRYRIIPGQGSSGVDFGQKLMAHHTQLGLEI